MSDIRTKLLRASFRGVNFSCRVSSRTLGFKSVTHTYPDSDNTIVEQMGGAPKAFALTIVFGVDDYFDERESLIRALTTAGEGTLVHPWYGELTVKVAGTFTLDESIEELGKGEFTVNFVQEVGIQDLTDSGINFGVITMQKESIFDSISAYIEGNFNVSGASSVFNNARAKFTEVMAGLGQVVNSIGAPAEQVNNMFGQINTMGNQIGNLSSNPAGLASSYTTLFNNIAGMLSPNTSKPMLEQLKDKTFNFGASDETLNVYDTNTQRIVQNNKVLNQSMQMSGLSQAMETVIYTEFKNEYELEDTKDAINTKFKDLLADDSIPRDIRNSIIELRANALAYMDSLRVAKIKEVKLDMSTPSQLLSYLYYDETDSAEELINLNTGKPSEGLRGQVKIPVEEYE